MARNPSRPASSPDALLREGRRLAEQGKLKKARICYRQALRADSRNPQILAELGAVEGLSGNAATARKHLQAAIGLAPERADYHFNLGEIERKLGRFPEAEKSFRAALSLDPDDPDASFGLGVCRLMQADPQGAIEALETARRLSPSDGETNRVLAKALERAGRDRDAATVLEHHLAQAPADDDARTELALLLTKLRHYRRADEAFTAVHARRPLPAQHLASWALAMVRSARHAEAVALLDEAIPAHDRMAGLFFVRALAHQHLGHFDQAEADLRAAVRRDPDLADAYAGLAQMCRLVPGDVDRLEEMLRADRKLPNAVRAAAGFALYRHLDAADRRDDAFAALAEANAIRARDCAFSVADHEALSARMQAVFTARFFEERAGEGHESPAPVFIFGMPRSGTSLVEQIVSAYPQVGACGETMIVSDLTARIGGYPESAAGSPPDWAARTAAGVLEELAARAGDHALYTDKTPSNYYNLGLVAWLFPKATLIYCERDPRDIGFSCFEQNFDYALDFACDLDAFVEAYRVHRALMAHWFEALPGRIVTMNYEALVADPRTEARRLTDACGLPWDDACIDTARFDGPVQTASFWQVRQPISARSVGKWRRYGDHLQAFVDRIDQLDQ